MESTFIFVPLNNIELGLSKAFTSITLGSCSIYCLNYCLA